MYIKDYDSWIKVKQRLEAEKRKVHIRAGEIRWVAFGVNIGSEIDGKGASFTRPGLILHVVGSHLALVVPMSTKVHDIAGYIPFDWKDQRYALCVHQIRVISQKRILARKGRVSIRRLTIVKDKVAQFFSLH
jgi:mRNA interferase MazF